EREAACVLLVRREAVAVDRHRHGGHAGRTGRTVHLEPVAVRGDLPGAVGGDLEGRRAGAVEGEEGRGNGDARSRRLAPPAPAGRKNDREGREKRRTQADAKYANGASPARDVVRRY